MVSRKYRYRLFCPDCLHINPQGCFGGDYDEGSEEEFDTPELAWEAGCEEAGFTIWDFQVIDENGVVIEVYE